MTPMLGTLHRASTRTYPSMVVDHWIGVTIKHSELVFGGSPTRPVQNNPLPELTR